MSGRVECAGIFNQLVADKKLSTKKLAARKSPPILYSTVRAAAYGGVIVCIVG